MSTEPDDTPEEKAQSPFQEITQPFIDLLHAPRALWGINAAYFLEGMVYFGMLGYMAMYFHEYVGLDDAWSGYMVGVLTSGITLSMFFLGGLGDKWGIRKALVIAFIFMIIGRAAMSAGPMLGLAPGGLGSPVHIIAMLGILLIVLGYGTYQPAAYAAVRQFTTPKTSAMAFAMLYALMNLGGWVPSFFSPIRKAVGISGAYGVFTVVSVLALILTAILLTRSVVSQTTEAAKVEKEAGKSDTQKKEEAEKKETAAAAKQKAKDGGLGEMIWHWLSHHPLADPKFAFFIFALIPVQTLFAHNWLTLPVYVARAYRPPVAVERCETMESSPEAIIALTKSKGAKSKG
ncbi:MAG: MFS transporter, partial [Deltaproteobacteria bacterium]|nr:MFS transporter [Deltaproteobacteria bacterium]